MFVQFFFSRFKTFRDVIIIIIYEYFVSRDSDGSSKTKKIN